MLKINGSNLVANLFFISITILNYLTMDGEDATRLLPLIFVGLYLIWIKLDGILQQLKVKK